MNWLRSSLICLIACPSILEASLSLELGSGLAFFQSSQNTYAAPFARVSYIPDPESTLITGEIMVSHHSSLKGLTNLDVSHQIFVGSAVFYEYFGSQSFRFALGVGMDRHQSKWHPLWQYRLGLGHFVNPRLAFHIDFTGRTIRAFGNMRSQFEGSLSLMARL